MSQKIYYSEKIRKNKYGNLTNRIFIILLFYARITSTLYTAFYFSHFLHQEKRNRENF